MMRNIAFNLWSTNRQEISPGGSALAPFGLELATEPILPKFTLIEAFEDGEPDLFSALHWKYELTERLYGRDTEIANVLNWARSEQQAATARLVTGEGGAGKTRLAAEVARRLKADGWTAGFLPRSGTVKFRFEKGLFLIHDYPEEQDDRTKGLFEKIAEIQETDAPVRVLLLSRCDFDTWRREAQRLEGRFGKQAIAAPGPLQPGDALALVKEASRRFAEAAGSAPPNLSGAADWLAVSATHRLPLFSSAAAIHAVLAPSAPFGLDGAELMRDLAHRELRRVSSASPSLGIGKYGLEKLLALAVLGDGLNERAITALKEAGALPGAAADFRERLKGSPWWRNGRLVRLEPDRPAAAFLDVALFDRQRAPLGDDDLPDWLYPALKDRAANFGDRLGRILFDLAALGQDAPGSHALDAALVKMIKKDPQRAVTFKEMAETKVPHQCASFTAEVSLKLAESSPEGSLERAENLRRAADNLTKCGRRDDALTAAQRASKLFEGLASANPKEFTYDVARSYNELANSLSNLGRHQEAVAVARHAFGIARDSHGSDKRVSLRDLAVFAHTLAICLSNIGEHEDALLVVKQEVEARRILAHDDPAEFTPSLALSLNSLANRLGNLGRFKEALAPAKESVKIRRVLARARPERFNPDLALSLSNLSGVLCEFPNRGKDALATAKESADLYRALARVQPAAFNPNLAASLVNLAAILDMSEQYKEALAAAQEGADLFRDLAHVRPAVFSSKLAGALTNLAYFFSRLGRHEEAHAAQQEVEELNRVQPAPDPAVRYRF